MLLLCCSLSEYLSHIFAKKLLFPLDGGDGGGFVKEGRASVSASSQKDVEFSRALLLLVPTVDFKWDGVLDDGRDENFRVLRE